MIVEVVAESGCALGEGPLWHPIEQCLYWLNIQDGELLRYEPATRRYEVVHKGRPIGAATYQEDGALLLFRDKGRVERFQDGQLAGVVVESMPGETSQFNDCIADPKGRVYVGTLPTEERQGRLYRFELDGQFDVVEEGVGCSNGLGFTLDLKHLYFTDSVAHTIWLYDYDVDTGEIANRRAFARTHDPLMPDGLTVDSQGDVWSAIWEGSCVLRYAPDGSIRQKVELPARKVTSVMFGGARLNELYITSAARGDENERGPYAGHLLRIRPSVTGRAEFPSRIRL